MVLPFQNENSLGWIDNSTYAFEAWHTEASYFTPFTLFIHDVFHKDSTVLDRIAWLDFQPTLDGNSNCTAIWAINSMILQWISLPCEQVQLKASYICEFKKNSTTNYNLNTILYSRVLQREILECPPNTTYLASLCVTVRTVEASSVKIETSPKICDEGSKPFHLSDVLNNEWQRNNTHFTDTVRLFYLRWPSLYDYQFIEEHWLGERMIIEIDMHEGHKIAAIDFSKSEYSNLRLRSLHGSFSAIDTHTLDIVCGVLPNLASSMCKTGHFQCSEGTCILEHYICDGHADCPDISDEADCGDVCSLYNVLSLAGKDCHSACMPGICTCHQLYFQCQNGGCVPWSRVCDGNTECPHGEDELYCLFYQKGFISRVLITQQIGAPVLSTAESLHGSILGGKGKHKSYNNTNVFVTSGPEYERFVLSGRSLNYFDKARLCTQPEETTCLKNFYGDCFPRDRYCIFEPLVFGRLGCRDGAHLRSCYLHSCPNFFKCPNDYCLPIHLICNGVPDCPNGEDEEACEQMSCPGFLLCSQEQICIHPHDLWTGHIKCVISQDDQALVGAMNCPHQCECLGQAIMCNNIELLSSFQTFGYTRLIIMEETTVAPSSFRWEDVTSEFLIVLKISGCEITSKNFKKIAATSFLKHLNLSNNLIDQLDSRLFSHMKNLESLDISRNLLQFLAFNVFGAAQRLEDLVASHNKIREVHCEFSNNWAHLKRLILSNNYMESLHPIVKCTSMFSYLREINVSYNRFHNLDYYAIFHPMRSLNILDTTPLSMCCFLSDVRQCYPKLTAKNTLCKYLMPSASLRAVFWFMGIFLVINASICIVYLLSQLRKRKFSLPIWLTIALFLSHWMLGLYFFGLAIADNFFSPYYSIYEHLWRDSVMCLVFDVLSLTCFFHGLFGSFLLSVIQMISVSMPFRVSDMDGKPFYIASGMWVGSILVVGALGSTMRADRHGVEGAVEGGVCLNLLWPGNPRMGWVAGTLAVPGILIISGFVFNQLMIIYTMRKSGRGMAATEASQVRRFRVQIRAFCCLLVQVLGSLPLFISYILTMSGISISDIILLYFGIIILVINPVANPFLHVYFSAAFIEELMSL